MDKRETAIDAMEATCSTAIALDRVMKACNHIKDDGLRTLVKGDVALGLIDLIRVIDSMPRMNIDQVMDEIDDED